MMTWEEQEAWIARLEVPNYVLTDDMKAVLRRKTTELFDFICSETAGNPGNTFAAMTEVTEQLEQLLLGTKAWRVCDEWETAARARDPDWGGSDATA
jgi:hypothetical protein